MPNPAPARPVRQIRNEGRALAELSGFEQLTLPLRTPRLLQPHTLRNCAVAWGGDQLRGFVIALGGAGRSCGASRHRGKPGLPATPLLQLKKGARTWQGFSDPKTSRGSFSSPHGAYGYPEAGTHALATAPQAQNHPATRQAVSNHVATDTIYLLLFLLRPRVEKQSCNSLRQKQCNALYARYP